MSTAIESVLQESRIFPPPEAFSKKADIPSMEAYDALHQAGCDDFEGFWARLGARAPLVAQALYASAGRG